MVNFEFSIENFEYFLLILVRISTFVFAAPVFGNTAVPRQAKVGLALFVSLILYNVVYHPELDYTSVIGYAVLVIKEGITGLLIGFSANICSSIVLFSGSIIDMDIGLSMATEFNPDMGTQTTLTGNLYYYVVMLLLIISDMHLFVLQAACDSFAVVPVGGAVFEMDHLLSSMIQYLGDLLVIGFRIFLPVFACMMVLNCILGVMAKVAPQMNMFAVGIQLKIIVGLVVLLMTIFLFPSVANMIFKEIKTMVVLFIEGMYE